MEQTKQIIEQEEWYFDATQMLPSKGASRSIMNYSVIIRDGKVDSYLPYMGRAYSGDYGSTNSPLIFEAPVESYNVAETKKGGYKIDFTTKTDNEMIKYTLSISSSGSATLSVQSGKRQQISYFGNLVPAYTEVVADN